MENDNRNGGIGFATLLGLLFIGLKLSGIITWSWWWVLAPFWGPALIMLVIAAVLLGVVMVLELIDKKK